tara:strand:- start:378 stop:824 length:447 start_codon:yes stop_codon:yes gene_type:complete
MSIDTESSGASASGSAPFPSPSLTWQALENRAALAAVELAEVRTQGVRFSLGAVATLLGAQLTGIALLAAVTAMSWDTEYRVAAPALATAVIGGTTLGLGLWWRARMRAWRPFDATRDQLSKDRDLFRAMMADRKQAEADPQNGGADS